MEYPQKPKNEVERLAELHDYNIVDSAIEKDFDEIVQLASVICDTPISLITLIDEKRQWFKARVGLDIQETSRDISFCGHAIHGDDLMMVTDVYKDERFFDNPLVTGKPDIKFYAGMPLITPSGFKLGTLCVIDQKSRDLTDSQKYGLQTLANQVVKLMEFRKVNTKPKINEEQFRGAFEHSAIGMALVSTKGKWLKVNKYLCELLGYNEEEFLSMTFQDIMHPDDLENDLYQIQQILDGEIDSYKMERRYLYKNGSIVWVLLSVSLVNDLHGNPLYFVSQIEDITKRKNAEEALKESLDHQKRIQESLNESKEYLEALADKLTRQNHQLANFAHITSHNLRSPVGNLNSLLRFYQMAETSEDKAMIFQKFEKVIQHLSNTLNELIEALKIQENTSKDREKLSFELVLNKIKEIIAGQIIETEAVISTDFSDAPEIEYDRSYLESIILNLISNAIKYRSPNRTPHIYIETRIVNTETILTVSDNGLGIDLAKHGKKLFGLHNTFHRHDEAKGVGLFLIKTQVEAMGGVITAKSEVDKGTIFTITFNKRIVQTAL